MRPPFGDSGRCVVLLLFLVLLRSGCATTPGPEDSRLHEPVKTETWGEVSLQDLIVPERIGQFSLVESEDYPGVELGVRLKYIDQSLPRAAIDAYVYPITKQETLSLAYVLESEMASVAEVIAFVARRNRQRAGEPAYFTLAHSTNDLPRGLAVALMLSSPNEEYMSYAFLSVRDHHFFKLRVTIPNEEVESGRDDYLQEVLDVLYPSIHFRSPIQPPDLTVTVYANVFLAPQHEPCNLSGWMLYGLEMLEQIQAGNYMDTFERERSARKRALDDWDKKRSEGEFCASDVFEAMNSAEAAGFLDEYVFDSYGRGTWPANEDMDFETWSQWSNANLGQHDPIPDPGVAIEWKKPKDDLSEVGLDEKERVRDDDQDSNP